MKGSSTASSIALRKLKSADSIPHKTARISCSEFSYAFQALNPGQIIIRLHFNPSQYKGFKGFRDLFNVEAGTFTLLSNFSASLAADDLAVSYFAKEFCLNIQQNQQLSITFSPATTHSGDHTYAFINGIEIISVPASVSYFHSEDVGVQVVGQKSLAYVDHSTALEIIQLHNVKQNPVPSTGDFESIFPTWAMGEANKIAEKNSTWKVLVDVGFRYLIRIHLSEIGIKIVGSGGVVFEVLINDMIAETNIDMVKEKSVNNIPWYRDYMVMMRGGKKEGKHDLSISVQSYDEFIDGHGLLAGFEVLKMSNLDNSLASPNPSPLDHDSPSQTLLLILGRRNAISTVAVIVISLASVIVHKLREFWEASRTKENNKLSARAERVCRRFSLAEIQLATRNFSDALLIGRGGFGKVYKGLIDSGRQSLAIKRQKSTSRQGAHEFLTEIEMLSELRHANLVSLIGYCNDHGEMILVYEYMTRGTLADHLYERERERSNCSALNWKQCLNICIGAGRGLNYLHTGHGVIHRDVKASNILLDENFVAKVSDFGLAKPEDKRKLQSHISTKVKGTHGYLDPFYLRTYKLTRKSDTYAFGVVLLEVLCGRPVVDFSVLEDERFLTEWARDNIRQGDVDNIVASSLREEISPNSLKTFVGVAERCLYDEPKNRPTMSQVVQKLEHALEQQERKRVLVLNEIASVSDGSRACNDAIGLSVNTGQLTTSLGEQTISYVVNDKLPFGKKERTKNPMHKPSRLWPWDTLWNRVNLSNKRIREADIKLAKFDWNTIADATNQFSSSNKVGVGRFGPVYKAVLSTELVVAVKRFPPASLQGDGLEEFKNLTLLLPNLQHANIIKLVGYSIYGEEILLLYEFMENGSLFTYLDEEKSSQRRNWAVRLKIIMGIARGLVYLHQDSGFRIIHRYISSRNILLDAEMNPKIAHFGSARTLPENEYEFRQSSARGTFFECSDYRRQFYGANLCYCYSVRSDVYCFGVVVLEIVSGKRLCTNYKDSSLLKYTWKLLKEGKSSEVVDESIFSAFPVEEALRCIQVGLLCTQSRVRIRPTMASVIRMLEGEELVIDPPAPRPNPSSSKWMDYSEPYRQY